MPIGLLDLPAELLIRIASNLPRSSALSLSLTCSTTRSAAEVAIWRELDLTAPRRNPYSWDVQSPTRSVRSPDGNQKDQDDDSIMVHPRGTSARRQVKDESYISSLSHHLTKDGEWRLRAIRSIQFDLDKTTTTSVRRLLNLLAPTLRRLVCLAPLDYKVTHAESPSDSAFNLLHQPFSQLRYLEFPIDHSWESRIRTLLPLTPNVRVLRLIPSVPFSGGWGEASNFPPAVDDGSWPILPYLQYLEIEQMSSTLETFVSALVSGSDKLRRVVLRDPEMAWESDGGDALLRCLSSMAGLQYLAVPFWCLGVMGNISGFERLKMLSVSEGPDDHVSSRIDDLQIPVLPSLERLFAHRSLNPIHIDIHNHAKDRFPSIQTQLRPDSTVNRILSSPKLRFIQYLTDPAYELVDDGWDQPLDREHGDLIHVRI